MMHRIIFLDRDGVINKSPGNNGYVTSWREFKFLPRALKAIQRLTKEGFRIAIISNQAGVAKGLMTETDLNDITKNMLCRINKNGGIIDSVQYCIHRDEDNCGCRKPKTGLFKKALKEVGQDWMCKFFIGDSERDIGAGRNFGCKTILVLSGKTKGVDIKGLKIKPDFVAKDLYEGIDYICAGRDRS